MALGGPIRSRRGAFSVRLSSDEREVLVHLIGEVDSLDDARAHVAHRLRPPGSTDEVVAREYAELTESGHTKDRSERRTAVSAMVRDPDRDLTSDELADLAGVVNEIRLVLGTALGVSDEVDEEPDDDPNAAAYHWLGWLLENMMRALTR